MWRSLIDEEAAAHGMRPDSWYLMMDVGMPSFSQRWVDGEHVTSKNSKAFS